MKKKINKLLEFKFPIINMNINERLSNEGYEILKKQVCIKNEKNEELQQKLIELNNENINYKNEISFLKSNKYYEIEEIETYLANQLYIKDAKYKKHTKYIVKQKILLEESAQSSTVLKNKINKLENINDDKDKIISEQEKIIKQLLEQLEIKNNKSIFDKLFN